jgi:tetratricopeptide (TPR) repeat protein
MSASREIEELGKVWLELGMANELVSEFSEYLQRRGRDLDAIIDVASALRKKCMYHEALATYDLGERWFPNNRFIWNNRGVVYRDWGHLDESVAAFQRALAIYPGYSKALEGQSDSLFQRGDFAAAAAGYQTVLGQHPDWPITWRNLALALSGACRSQESIAAYERSLTLMPDDTQALYDYALELARVGRGDDAVATLDRLLALDPNDSDAREMQRRFKAASRTPVTFKYPAPERESLVFRLGRSKEELDRVAELVNAAIDSGQTPPAKPPRLFISYRWGTEDQDEWMARLVSALESRGYDVVFDRNVQSHGDPLPVPDLVALIASCTHFAPILTEGYRRRVETRPGAALVIEDGWVFDEYQIAVRLSAAKRLIFQGIWRSGPVLPPPFTRENVCDFRDDAAFDSRVEEHFPVRMALITGLRPDGTARTIGPVPRTEIQRFGRSLEATGEFQQFVIAHL